jgi:hypothetical protein
MNNKQAGKSIIALMLLISILGTTAAIYTLIK